MLVLSLVLSQVSVTLRLWSVSSRVAFDIQGFLRGRVNPSILSAAVFIILEYDSAAWSNVRPVSVQVGSLLANCSWYSARMTLSFNLLISCLLVSLLLLFLEHFSFRRSVQMTSW